MTNDVRQVVERAAEEQAREMARWLNDVGLGDYPVSPHPESMSVGEACYVDLKARLLVAIGDVAKSARERAEKAEADVETAKRACQMADEAVARALKRAADAEAKLTSPPAPSGWQQRIAAALTAKAIHGVLQGPWNDQKREPAILLRDAIDVVQQAVDAGQPAPVDVQQRIAAMESELTALRRENSVALCQSCTRLREIARDSELMGTIVYDFKSGETRFERAGQNAVDAGQNAKDALPPSSSASEERGSCYGCDYGDVGIVRTANQPPRCGKCNSLKVVTDRGYDYRKSQPDALPPAPEASPAKFKPHDWTHDWVSDSIGTCWCRHCGSNPAQADNPCPRRWPSRLEADASPAKDPIADAVDAQLDPLKAELVDIGHKLAKEEPACCIAVHDDGWYCTLSRGHAGEHIATNEYEFGEDVKGRVFARWSNEARA